MPSTSETPEGQLEQPQASGTREALWNGPPLTRGVRGVLCFCRVVRLLERAEEGCEGIELNAIDYPSVVSSIVRCKYSQSDIEAIVLNGSDTEEHASEYVALQAWRAEAKRIAKIVVGK